MKMHRLRLSRLAYATLEIAFTLVFLGAVTSCGSITSRSRR